MTDGHPEDRLHTDTDDDPEARAALEQVRQSIGKAVVGHQDTVTGLLVALLVRGHVLLEGVPGVAKTLLVSALARSLDLRSTRVQFTPDLMPSDVIGQTLLDERGTNLRFRPGPVFTNLLIADELNRTPPRTQAALLEAMQERQVSVDGTVHALDEPFLVVATQNPVEYEGTYPLPEAQLDRFLFKLVVEYPSEDEERNILDRHLSSATVAEQLASLSPVAGIVELDRARAAVDHVRVTPAVRDYAVALTRATRAVPGVELGVSPRGATMLLRAARAWAWLQGATYVSPDDVKSMTRPVFAHRLRLRPELELEGASVAGTMEALLTDVTVPT